MTSKYGHVRGYGEEYENIKFKNFLDWFVHVEHPQSFWDAQPTYLIVQILFLVGGLLTLFHALKNGGRLPFLWLGLFLHGLIIECASYWIPAIDNFWHSQTPVIFLGRRLPLHIMFLYPFFTYNATVAVSKLKLPLWAEPFAVGLCTVLIDLPYDIVGVRYLHRTWHDTDPNIEDRHYWVPWNSYYFHIAFAASFIFWFHLTRKLICKTEKWEKSTFKSEILCTIISAMLGVPGGILLFIPNYHVFHDIYNMHSEVTYFFLFGILLAVIWTAERCTRSGNTDQRKICWSTKFLFMYLVLYYATFIAITATYNPENEIAVGFKEKIGPCDEWVDVHTPFGVLEKRKYLCPNDFHEDYFDWHCLPEGKPPKDGSHWYTACGTPFENRMEYISIVSVIMIIATIVYYNLHFLSFGDIFIHQITKGKQKKQ